MRLFLCPTAVCVSELVSRMLQIITIFERLLVAVTNVSSLTLLVFPLRANGNTNACLLLVVLLQLL